MSTFKKTLFAFLIFFIQILILDHLPLSWGIQINLFIYIFLCLIPFNYNKTLLLLIGFAIGMLRDLFTFTYGLYAFASTLLMFLQYYYFRLPQFNKYRKADKLLYANSDLLGWPGFLLYITIFTIIFSFTTAIIESFTTWMYLRLLFIIKEIFFSILFICIAELIRSLLFHKEAIGRASE